MSEATRNLALGHAIAHHIAHTKTLDPTGVLETADAFNAFIAGDAASTAAKPAAKATALVAKPAAAKPAAAKPVVSKPKAAPVEDAAEEAEEAEAPAETAEGPTKEDVGNAIASLINSNLSAECAALLKKFKAKSLSGIAADDYGAFVAEAETLLMNA